ncbi:tripartite tricarboxylate transporter permease [Candidatus Woesearchaeota archaeon]|nr:tripartite tricarboxylate transporter permease [Candidatus Woesearchaeota archaeon]
MAFLGILLALMAGSLCGIVTGIVPGIHVNLVSVMLISFGPLLLQIATPLQLAVFIISLAIIHTFLDAIPSIYLGAPDEGQVLNVLPGHRLLIKGEGHNAVIYTIIGSLGALVLGVILFPFFILGMRFTADFITKIMGYLLIAIAVYMIGRETKRWKCLGAFLLSGVLGLLVFNITELHQPLFPLLSGMFGFSLLLMSLAENSKIPEQDLNKPLMLSKKSFWKSTSAATGMGFIAAFLPGFGSSQAAIMAQNFVGDIGDEGFLALVSGLNTANMLLSIAAVYVLDKARNGAIVTVNELIGKVGFEEMLLFLGVCLVVGGLGAILTVYGSKIFCRWIVKVNYQKLVLGILVFITLLTFYFDGIIGLIILITSTAIGLVASSWGIGKNHLMGCLMVPVILYFVL